MSRSLPDAPGLRLLVVDDDDGIRTMLAAFMRQRGWLVDETGSAAGGRECLCRLHYDLLLLDQYLPDGSGLGLAEELAGEDCEVILMTAYASVESAVRGVRARVADYLTKPFPSLEFVHSRLLKVAEVLQLKRDNERLLERLKNKTEQLEALVVRDPLTELYNHGFIHEALAREITRSSRHGLEVSLVNFSIDGMQAINDSQGLHTGDKLLQRFARILSGASPFRLRNADIVARYGGDEFALLLPHTPKRGAAVKAEALRNMIASTPFTELGLERVTISAGVATYPDDADDSDSLFRATRMALSAARRAGPDHICAFSRELEAAAEPDQVSCDLMERRAALIDSIERSAFKFHFQPILHAGEGGIYGYEALVRPTHPALPNPFALFSTAEATGRVKDLGRVVRRGALACVTELPFPFSLFVNLHPYELGDPTLLELDAEVDAQRARIVFEITEGSAIDDFERVSLRIDELRTRGYRIAIDDLGSGYAGLLALSRLTPDFVKLDRDLVQRVREDSRTERLVRHIVEFANGEGIGVVAEGIETQDQLDILESLGCGLVQGFFLGRPAPLAFA